MVTRLRENVWWIDLQGVNAYLVDDGGVLTLVDAGMPWNHRKIARACTQVGDSIGDVDRILITHYDIDHVGGLGRIDGLSAPIFVGTADRPFLTGEEKPSWSTQKGLFQRAVDWWRTVPSLPVESVDDGDEIGSFVAYHTPGHTPGHTIYVSTELSVAFLGDLVCETGGKLRPAPRIICQDYQQTTDTIVSVADRLPSFEAACIGHGTPFARRGSEHFTDCVDRLRRKAPSRG